MTIRQLRDLLATMNPDGEALVTLFHADGSAVTFAIEDVTATHGEAHIEISDEEPAACRGLLRTCWAPGRLCKPRYPSQRCGSVCAGGGCSGSSVSWAL